MARWLHSKSCWLHHLCGILCRLSPAFLISFVPLWEIEWRHQTLLHSGLTTLIPDQFRERRLSPKRGRLLFHVLMKVNALWHLKQTMTKSTRNLRIFSQNILRLSPGRRTDTCRRARSQRVFVKTTCDASRLQLTPPYLIIFRLATTQVKKIACRFFLGIVHQFSLSFLIRGICLGSGAIIWLCLFCLKIWLTGPLFFVSALSVRQCVGF